MEGDLALIGFAHSQSYSELQIQGISVRCGALVPEAAAGPAVPVVIAEKVVVACGEAFPWSSLGDGDADCLTVCCLAVLFR